MTTTNYDVKAWVKANIDRLGDFRPSHVRVLMQASGIPVDEGRVGRAVRALAAEGYLYRPGRQGTYRKAPEPVADPEPETSPEPKHKITEEHLRRIIHEEATKALRVVLRDFIAEKEPTNV